METKYHTTTIGNNKVNVPEELAGYELHQKQSSQVEFFGIHKLNKSLYVQFKNGGGYVYPNCSEELLTKAVNADSIGSFVRTELVKPNAKFSRTKNKITVL